jgi:hypothetical protein
MGLLDFLFSFIYHGLLGFLTMEVLVRKQAHLEAGIPSGSLMLFIASAFAISAQQCVLHCTNNTPPAMRRTRNVESHHGAAERKKCERDGQFARAIAFRWTGRGLARSARDSIVVVVIHLVQFLFTHTLQRRGRSRRVATEIESEEDRGG